MALLMPRIEITLSKIQYNAQFLCAFYGQKGIDLMGVSKAVLGNPLVAEAMILGGVKFIADSRIENIQRMRAAGIFTQFVLLRTPLSQAESVIQNADISLNTELRTIKELSHYAVQHNKTHQIIVMAELGDLREGVLPKDLSQFIKDAEALPSIQIVGIGCNLACYGGIKPDNAKMRQLSELTHSIEKELRINLALISGGNSANYDWYTSAQDVGRINNLRLGESILLGYETAHRKTIPGLDTSAFKLVAEVIESKKKPSLPNGESCQDAFGNSPQYLDRGIHQRVIIALGIQDILVSGLSPLDDLEILGASSDHIILEDRSTNFPIGSEVTFGLTYGGLLAAMTSPFIKKHFIGCPDSVLPLIS